MNFTFPNLLSILRMGLIPLFIIAVLQGNPTRALVIFLAAGVTDAVDGFLARVLKQASPLGAYLDPMADKLLLTSAYIILAIPGLYPGEPIPVWIAILVIARDVMIVVCALSLYLALDITKFKPTFVSKVNTVAQVLAVILVLIQGVTGRFTTVALGSLYLVAGLTILSGVDYVHQVNVMILAKTQTDK